MRDVRIFHSPENVMFTFIETHKGEDRLVVGAHGVYSTLKKTKICTESGNLNAFRLAIKLKLLIDFESIRYIKLVVCGGGNRYQNSFIADLSKHFFGIYIKGYIGTVYANLNPDIMREIIYSDGYPESVVKKLILTMGTQKIDKSPTSGYHSVTCLNGRVIKESAVNTKTLNEFTHRLISAIILQ